MTASHTRNADARPLQPRKHEYFEEAIMHSRYTLASYSHQHGIIIIIVELMTEWVLLGNV